MRSSWTIAVTFPHILSTKKLGIYTSRAEAEQDACRYRKFLKNATVNVYWEGRDNPSLIL